MKTIISSHTCNNPFQDRAYGRGMRLFNQTKKGLRCTVCGHENTSGGWENDKTVVKKAK